MQPPRSISCYFAYIHLLVGLLSILRTTETVGVGSGKHNERGWMCVNEFCACSEESPNFLVQAFNNAIEPWVVARVNTDIDV